MINNFITIIIIIDTFVCILILDIVLFLKLAKFSERKKNFFLSIHEGINFLLRSTFLNVRVMQRIALLNNSKINKQLHSTTEEKHMRLKDLKSFINL